MTRRRIVPGIGHLGLAKLSRDDVRRFVRQLGRTKSQRVGADQVLSGRTVQCVYSILRRALEDARREELVGAERGAGGAVASIRASGVRAVGARRGTDVAGGGS